MWQPRKKDSDSVICDIILYILDRSFFEEGMLFNCEVEPGRSRLCYILFGSMI